MAQYFVQGENEGSAPFYVSVGDSGWIDQDTFDALVKTGHLRIVDDPEAAPAAAPKRRAKSEAAS